MEGGHALSGAYQLCSGVLPKAYIKGRPSSFYSWARVGSCSRRLFLFAWPVFWLNKRFHQCEVIRGGKGSASGSLHSHSPMGEAAEARIHPVPVANKVSYKMELFNDIREDRYFWLRDDNRKDPDVLAYLGEENAYTEHVMADSKSLEQDLYKELRGRIQEDDMSVPLRKGPFFYYERTLKDKQYVQHCRRHIVGGAGPGDVKEVMNGGPDAPKEEILLDENKEAEKYGFYSVEAFKVSPDHKLLAYGEDTKGDEVYTLYVVDIHTGQSLGKPLCGLTSYIEWLNNDTLVYVTQDDLHRPFKVWRHKLGTEQSEDVLLYHEKNEEFSLSLLKSESQEYVFVNSNSKITSFVLYLKVEDAPQEFKPLTPCISGTDFTVSHRGGHFFIQKRNDELYNSELLVCSIESVSDTTVLLPHRPSVKLQEIQAFENHLVVFERQNGLLNAVVYALPPVGQMLTELHDGHQIQFPESPYMIESMENNFFSPILRYGYSSLRTPMSVYDYDMDTGESVLKKVEPVLGGFDADNYVTVREWATALDGTRIPISIVYHKHIAKLDGSDPLLLYGYGSYEICIEPEFSSSRLSLIDRGFVYAIAHVRGGGEMGRKWYEDGKLKKKKNTFTDFIACAEHLLDKRYGSQDKLCINGRSAGGLLMGAVLNMRPDLFKVVVAGVPFVDVLTTMLDSSIPLTTAEWEEWGDPRKEDFYFYMKSYSPMDNVKSQHYPNILITAGLNDPRVAYWEPAKFVAKLREHKTDDNVLLLKCEMGAGHFSKSGRFDKLEETALTYAFILKCVSR
ncbi:hypothetical protein KP509_28G031500 [Ceratopteris richardii]|uniref:Prolyl endopeptidase n=1 Tax=Ceratopteris richardii TaxID=49495 RepID=A0A8T2RCL4_CERRI|nr:hypothetical protein KP509_28G031500 [Ceratopteris richardii]KAH7293576.1 hypothetical protein KP509_28G031500 [Ceratopteris richardii]KAH7293577.1 hypothetical protein KP509_28G031500 [Ceratopteris richardii]KAH7293578.1 hypothetical protein KP509_28G031500 [Ceratopteris richardii]